MSTFKAELDNVLWSFSSLSMYDECPYSFFMHKIDNLKGDNNAYAEIGSYGHDLNERLFKQEITPEEALSECVDEFDDHITEEISEASKDKKFMALCDYLEGFDQESMMTKYEVVAVEQKMRWKIGKYNMIGFIDLILKDKETGETLLVDHKSSGHFLKKDGKPLKNMEESLERYKKQMYMYADAMKKILGYYPNKIVWNHFLDGGQWTVIDFNLAELDATLQWIKKCIQRIYKDSEFKAVKSYVRCYQLCNYRNGLCEFKDLEEEE